MAFEQADQVLVLGGLAPQVGAADAGGQGGGADVDGPPRQALGKEAGGEAEGAPQHVQGRRIDAPRALADGVEMELGVFPQLDAAAFGQLDQHPGAAAGDDPVPVGEGLARHQGPALAAALQPGRRLHGLHHRLPGGRSGHGRGGSPQRQG